MARVFKRPRAEQDLMNLWLYLAEAADPALAERYLLDLDDELSKIAPFPESGRARDELSPGLRSLPFDRLVLFYLPHPEGIELVRVLAGAQDIDQIAEEGGFAA
jgi:toxin ParE1/3/4